MPLKDWKTIQENLKTLGLKGELEVRQLATHKSAVIIAALTAKLHLAKQTEQIGDRKACIIVPKKRDWRTLTA